MTKKECDNTAKIMSREGIKAVSYHAGLADKKRIEVQMQWTSNKTNVRGHCVKLKEKVLFLIIYFR